MGNCTLDNIDLTSMDLKHAIRANCIFRRCIFINTQLQQSDLSGARFIDCQFRNVDMTETDLRGAAWENGAIVRSSMQRAALDPRYVADRVSQSLVKERTTFSNCRIDRSSFIRARMQEVVMMNCHITAQAFPEPNKTEARHHVTRIKGTRH